MKKHLFISALCLLFTNQINAKEIEQYEVSAKLEESRNGLSPKTGSSLYSFSRKDIDNMPLGQATSINQVLLRAPGVVQDSFGQIRVRGDHSNLQYRINGVIIPKGIGSSFGQLLDTRFADKVDFLTGAMPAQYGYRTGGVVEITTKDGAFKQGGRSELLTGTLGNLGFAQEFMGSAEGLNYYLNGSYLQNDRGIEPPTSARNSEHNATKQDKFFAYFSKLLDAQTKFSVILGNSRNRFQLPNTPGETAQYELDGVNNFPSSKLNQNQTEQNRYAIASLQGVTDSEIDYQLSAFVRESTLDYRGDDVGNLIYNGVASDIDRSSVATGIQADFAYKLNDKHTLRSGLQVSNEQVRNNRRNAVFTTDDDGEQTSTIPITLRDKTRKNAQNYAIFLQDEYKPTKKLTVNYGLRYDGVQSYEDEQQLSPRLGAVYEATDKTSFHAGYARYFTPPQNELIAKSTLLAYQNTTNKANSLEADDVKAERTNYFDLGVKHKLNKNFTIGLDGYYKDVKNFLDEGQFGQALVYAPINFRNAKVYGAELSLNYQKENFSSYFNLSTQRAKAKQVVSNQYLLEEDELEIANGRYVNADHDQTVAISSGVSYKHKNTTYIADAIFGSGLVKDLNHHMPSYLTFNTSIAHDFNLPYIKKFNVRLSALNLLDREYRIRSGEGVGVGAQQFGQRRTYYMILSKEF